MIRIKACRLKQADRAAGSCRPLEEPTMAKPRIVILGAGLGGAIAAFEIRDAVGDKRPRLASSRRATRFTLCRPTPGSRSTGGTERPSRCAAAGLQEAWRRLHGRGQEGLHRHNQVELKTGQRSTTTIWSSPPVPISPSTRFRASALTTASPSRSAMSTTPRWRRTRSTGSCENPGPSWWARCRAPPASARPMNSR